MIYQAIISIVLIIACMVLFRMGGAEGYPKAYRRFGSTACCIAIICLYLSGNALGYVIVSLCAYLGCASYFEKINYIVKLWWKEIDLEREYVWNFAVEGIVGQCAVLGFGYSYKRLLIALVFGIVFGAGKVLIDGSKLSRHDVKSELFCGLVMALGVWINCLIGG